MRFVECDRWGVLWVSHDRGISVSTDGERFTDLRLPSGVRFQAVCTVRDREDHLWVGCDTEGVYSLGFDAQYRVVSAEHYAKSDFFGRISDNDVSCLCIDRSGCFGSGRAAG